MAGHEYSTVYELDVRLDIKRLHSVNDPSALVNFSTVFIKIAPIVNGAKAPRPCAGVAVTVVSGVISEARERIMTLATFVSVGALKNVMVGTIRAKEVADAIADRWGALTRCVITLGVGVGVGMRVGGVGMLRMGIVGKLMRRVRRVVMGRV